MYTRQQASQLRKNFWTRLGQYMHPVRGADGEPVNWLNYKTGIRHLYFRMDANDQQAAIAIEIQHPDPPQRQHYFEKFSQLEKLLEQATAEPWQWQLQATDEDGGELSRIGTELNGVNVFDINDWPAMISFLKPRMLALDEFWVMVREGFE